MFERHNNTVSEETRRTDKIVPSDNSIEKEFHISLHSVEFLVIHGRDPVNSPQNTEVVSLGPYQQEISVFLSDKRGR